MKSNKGSGLIELMLAVGIMSIIASGMAQMASYTIKLSNTARVNSDILAYVSVLKTKLELAGSLPTSDTTTGSGWSVKNIVGVPQAVGCRTFISYRAVFKRDTNTVLGPSIVSRDIGAIGIQNKNDIDTHE
jgi:Tfp pilus assembly protein PilV